MMPAGISRLMFSAVICVLAVATVTAALATQPVLTDLSGKPVVLSEYRGRVVLVNFWATWCAPCRKEMPELNQLSKQLDTRRAVVLGIAADEADDVKAFVNKLGIGYRIAAGDADLIFAWSTALGNFTEGLPFTILLDSQGVIRWKKSGGSVDAKEVAALVDDLLDGKTATSR